MHIYILPQCSTTAASVLNSAGMDAQFERSCCAISRGILNNKLEKQNTAIYEREQQLASVEKELAGAKGIFKAKQRKELQEQAEQLKVQIASMKQYLSSIVQGYGYKNVKEFLAEYGSIPNSV